ncbi:uncharacterized protein MELLADRAFT_87403 [Melampsora larici-populina 98AG31]|uniref:Uncharacterized protein n=1 Tax=Melampsora larici-populina (strain 98AG31 / pathotype 3-4-7) TaxID=747676 RepID=F4RN67_MELLP|nr:uncharacterized protein MELLADRAFT_87403 [Melampsora larici-populina 98AG31]EGG06247.1 hypothetical protein MELLADRAFT_87403 [Melampsora larici-populina 98AG31]
MFNFPTTTTSKSHSGSLADARFSRTQPPDTSLKAMILPAPPRLPLPQGLLSSGPGSFSESVSRSCAFLGQDENIKMATTPKSRNARRSVAVASTLTRSPAIRHAYTSSSSSNTSSSSSSSAFSSSSQSSQMSATSSLGSSSTSKSVRQERRKGAHFTKIVISREDRKEDCFLYAARRPASSSSLSEDFFKFDSAKGLELPRNLSSVRMTRNNVPQVVSLDHTRHVSHRADICEGKVPPSPAVTVFSNEYEEDVEGDEEALEDDESHYGYPRPSSSMSTRSDPFEFSAYLSQPASRDTGRSLSRASSVTIRPTKRDSVVIRSEHNSPSLPPPTPSIPTPRLGPPNSVLEALRALKSIQSRPTFLFNVDPEDVDDESPSYNHWPTVDPSQVGIAL